MNAVVLVLVSLCLTWVVQADDICKEVSASAKKLNLKIPSNFVVDIEVVKKEDKNVQSIRMYYSQTLGMIRLDILDKLETKRMYFYFDDNEILLFDMVPNTRGKCKVIPNLSDSVDDFLFGGTPSGTKKPAIPVPLAAIHFAGLSGFQDHKINQKLVGKSTVRDKVASVYTSCQRWKSDKNDIVLNVTHYFADDMYAFPYTNKKANTLLAMTVTGFGKINGRSAVDVDHTYNYFNFRIDSDLQQKLETPEGVYCKGRVTDKEMPKLPKYISFSGETIMPAKSQYMNVEQVYDFTGQFAIIKSSNQANDKKDTNRYTLFFDFKKDKLLFLDTMKGSCSNADMSTAPKFMSLYHIARGKAIMNDPQGFFFAPRKDFVFVGKRMIRGMLSDVWVAPTSKLPSMPNAIVEFYFAPNVSSWNDFNPYQEMMHYPVPVKFRMWSDDSDLLGATENIFHVDYNMIRSESIDLTRCYPYTAMFQLVLKGKKKAIVASEIEEFKSNAISDFSAVGNISMFQVSQMKLYFSSDDAFMEFKIIGDDPIEVAAAFDNIVKALRSGKIKMYVKNPTTKYWDTTLKIDEINTIDMYNAALDAQKDSDSNNYSTGSMAGLGIGMAIIGLLCGAGAGFAHSKYL